MFLTLYRWLPVFGFILFLSFSFLVAKEIFSQFDFDTMVRIQNKIPRSLDSSFSYLSLLGSLEVTSIILLIFLILSRQIVGIGVVAVYVLALAIGVSGKLFLHHPGPPSLFFRNELNYAFPSAYIPTEYSFPSGHMLRATFLSSFILIVFLHSKHSLFVKIITSVLIFLFVLAMIISRISLGEHWPTDVLGGFLLGASTGILAAGVFLGSFKKMDESALH